MSSETIYALSSGAVPSGVAVVRLSGPRTRDALRMLAGELPAPRRASLRTIRSRNGSVLDSGLVLFFPSPSSFTGEDCAELQVHGSRAVVNALFDELAAMQDVRMATEGEFSRRAFENGKLDLVEIEGLADLIAAETEMQRRLAVEHGSGTLSKLYDSWAERLTRARALIEAELDFADEDDVPGSVSEMVWDDVAGLRTEIESHLSHAQAGEIIRDGYKVVIAGAPNAGKSTLMNALAQREIAIVTDIAGTTRDVLHVDLDINGFLVRLYDTAGLRDTEEVVEREGIRRAEKIISEADLVLYLEDMTDGLQGPLPAAKAEVLRVGTKADISADGNATSYELVISAIADAGLLALRTAIAERLERQTSGYSLAIPSRRRQRDSLSDCLKAIDEALANTSAGLDIRAESLRVAGNALGRITGRVDVENLLDVIFSEFCIGK
ncbi:tRNA uridine-5-carboxymethylaminomethyl(34) synthesis GTPase MnmE [Rhizobium sp. P32RR-XVIII]|uniref:tRNA uridine-5-carboxymethylaminomethyl(34) synthesis GTPase MnmE n=1 Tax=Rhizobium sp. P32RR-XVIII TaxID=2726738 RepID=UPI001456CB34|nr:tRNA uridine-5-carboxymethylaminomethyl(34) synthesis GTPase MnmE [Rhizobium sp. P32RR-XVIII]NLS05873.1 tRNA uridine-5-carboxymethylaminomethyl(34) synthesis GTPase MnmE [Rhizobium sp. P32RR-XVIII]